MELIGYLSNGYPSFEESFATAKLYQEGGMDTVQIDFPARDPYFEGEHIARRMKQSLEQCSDWQAYMDNISAINRNFPDMDIILLVYDYTVKEIGVERFIRFCKEENLMDITYIGDDHSEVKDCLMAAGIRISCYVQFHLNPKEVENARESNGFVYLQSKPQIHEDYLPCKTLGDCVHYLRDRLEEKRKIYTGVGLRTPDDVSAARRAGCDGAFVGSSIMKEEGNKTRLLQTIRAFKEASSGVAVS